MKTKLVQSRASGYWIIQYTDANGKRRKHSTGKKDRQEAFQYLVLHHDELTMPVQRRPEHITLSQFFEEYSKWVIGRDKKVGDNRHHYRHLIKHFGDIPMKDLTVRDLEQFLSTKRSIWTQKHFYEGLAASFQKAVDWEYIEVNPWRRIKKPKPPEKLPAYFSKEDFARLIEATDSELYRDLYQIAAYTGMRAGELQHLKWDNVDFKNRLVYVRSNNEFRTKTRRDRSIPMNDRVVEILTRRFETFSHRYEYVFFNREGNKLSHETTSKPIMRTVRKVGLNDELHFHSLRHTFATWAVQSGMPLYAVSKLMGHSTTRMTERYAQFSTAGLHERMNGL